MKTKIQTDVFRTFSIYHPDLVEKMVDWSDESILAILVEIDDGRVYLFDSLGDTYRLMRRDTNEMSDEEVANEFSKRVMRMIMLRGLDQKKLADRIGVNENTISRYITGKSLPNYVTISKIAKALDCDIKDLFYEGVKAW